jgi:nitric-oxide synthase
VTLALLPRQDCVDFADAHEFLEQFHAETNPAYPLRRRLRRVRAEIDRTGTYVHTEAEVAFGARVAWRNSARCTGRLYWHGLHVRDRRAVRTPAAVADECAAHLRECTRGGRIRSTITVFAPDRPGHPGPRIVNDQLVRYAGHRTSTGAIRGDRGQVEFTDYALALGWPSPDPPGRFDLLPLLITSDGVGPEVHELPRDVVMEVPLVHPEFDWFADLRLRWHAVPAISNMPLQIGGITYPAAPFNGWYVGTEIGARNLADAERYDLLPVVADRMGLSRRSERTLWRDRAVIELVRAVQHSFDVAGVTMSDHHEEARRFLKHVAKEERAGRSCPADWSWIVPPVSGSLTPVFHRYYDEPDPTTRPAYLPPPDTLRGHPRR